INIPLIVGGGINTKAKAEMAFQSGADMLVLCTAVEKHLGFISEVAKIRDQMND
ncbi:MAG: geranylgeranylglyceryl/heptaprenylglyceryl phosphate synthase, partial [Cyclobacteriaceae bacterium]|nr:geranylgeranylglyceryl/heptaprenylglyceryl phosphate synthase [Cyclobacteriaceae bacterium]